MSNIILQNPGEPQDVNPEPAVTEEVVNQEFVSTAWDSSEGSPSPNQIYFITENLDMDDAYGYYVSDDFPRHIGRILNQRKTVGQVAVVDENSSSFFYLILNDSAKNVAQDVHVDSCVADLRHILQERQICDISAPKCPFYPQLDRMLEDSFGRINVKVQLRHDEKPFNNFRQRFVREPVPKTSVSSGSIIIYFVSLEKCITEEMKILNKGFTIGPDYEKVKERKLGTLIITENRGFFVCGCTVKNSPADPIDYESLEQCLTSLKERLNNKNTYQRILFLRMDDPSDALVNEKLCRILLYQTPWQVLTIARDPPQP